MAKGNKPINFISMLSGFTEDITNICCKNLFLNVATKLEALNKVTGNFNSRLMSRCEMCYEGRWKVLADMAACFRKKGESVPQNVLKDLRSAKTMIQVLKADPTHVENIQKVEEYLQSVESKLVLTAQEKFGEKFVQEWMRRLGKAGKKEYEERLEVSRFVPRLPRGEHWVRVQVSENVPIKDVESLAERNRLSHKMQKDGYMLVYGDKERVKLFVKKMAEKQRGAKKVEPFDA